MATLAQSPSSDRKHLSPANGPTTNGRRDSDQNGSAATTSPSLIKRHSTSSVHEEENGKKKRRKVNHACVYCRRSHMTCDLQRPCARCIKRDIGHLCHDEPRDPPKRSKSDLGVAELAPAPDGGVKDDRAGVNGDFAAAGHEAHQPSLVMPPAVNGGMGAATQFAQPTPVSPVQLRRAASVVTNTPGPYMQNAFQQWNQDPMANQFHDVQHLHPSYIFATPEVTSEYNMLNEFLGNSLVDDGALMNWDSDAHQMLVNDPLLATTSFNPMTNLHNLQAQHQQQQQQQQHLQAAPPTNTAAPTAQPAINPDSTLHAASKAGEEISRPGSAFPISEKTLNQFYMTAADPAGLSSAEDRLHKLLTAKHDAGILKPYNYVKGYARLNSYMSKSLARESQARILKQLDRFRPKFREATQKLTDMQLVLVEMWFERSLMEYDRVFASMAIPACCWRRTGEIFRGNREMAELIGVPWENLKDGKLAIHEIIAEDSLVSYWEKFGAIAFDQGQKAILTSCSLKTPKWDVGDSGGKAMGEGGGTIDGDEKDGEGTGGQGPGGGKARRRAGETVKCCFSFTIRRDSHNIPSLIVGNFLPIRQRPFCTYQASRPV